eukprot:692725-Amphidinium_carterae.1
MKPERHCCGMLQVGHPEQEAAKETEMSETQHVFPWPSSCLAWFRLLRRTAQPCRLEAKGGQRQQPKHCFTVAFPGSQGPSAHGQ